MEIRDIIITVCDGEIQTVEAPDNCRVIVRDYDEAKKGVKPIGKATVKDDSNGDKFVESVWAVTNVIDDMTLEQV